MHVIVHINLLSSMLALFLFQLDGCVFIMLKSLSIYGVLGSKDQ